MNKEDFDFAGFPKMGRLSREMIITEKLDGTNAQVLISENGKEIIAGSRTRWITPQDDNYGFAKWVEKNKNQLLQLGPGRHFGEWWGGGIQRKYGLSKDDKRFSLFNTTRWALHGTIPQEIPTLDPRVVRTQEVLPECVGLVPVLCKSVFDTVIIDEVLRNLHHHGSMAAPGFMKPEGIVVFHTAANVGFKKTLEHDGIPKSMIK